MTDDQNPGGSPRPTGEGGAASRDPETQDMRRALRGTTGLTSVDAPSAQELVGRAMTTGPRGHADESTPAADDKVLHEQLPELDAAELARLSVLEPGTQLEQGSTYLDLNDRGRGPFKAIGGQQAEPGNRYIAKRDTDYELWNRLAGQHREAEVERPAETD